MTEAEIVSKPVAYGRTACVDATDGVCDKCEAKGPVLIASTCGGEYGEVSLCLPCILNGFQALIEATRTALVEVGRVAQREADERAFLAAVDQLSVERLRAFCKDVGMPADRADASSGVLLCDWLILERRTSEWLPKMLEAVKEGSR